ncbi:MAG TPA: CinA family protein [Aquifex aeolicus]|nr:CinA family protein [Aquifex aeolicus]
MESIIPFPSDYCEEKPLDLGYILRTFEISKDEIKRKLRGFSYELRESLSGIDLAFKNKKDQIEAKKLLEGFIYTDKPESIEQVLGRALRDKGISLGVAESCTGGMLSSRIVNVPGSSEYFIGGFIVYSNELKIKYLGVKEETLEKFGAVSRETCFEMLMGVKKNLKTDCGVAITGIAGPGGTPKKPEGLTYIGIFAGDKITVIKRIFRKGRNGNRFLSTQTAMFYLLKIVKRL